MLHSKLIDTLRCFSNQQIRSLGDAAHSPFFNKKAEVISLYDFLLSFAPTFDHPTITKANAFKHIYGSQKYDEKKIGYIMSDLNKLIDDFLAHDSLRNRPMDKYLALLDIYNDWEQEKAFRKVLKMANQFQEKEAKKDNDYYLNKFKIFRLQTHTQLKQKAHAKQDAFQKSLDNLDLYYIATKLEWSCAIKSRKTILNTNYDLKLFEEISQYLAENPQYEIAHPVINIYRTVLQCYEEENNEEHFIKLQNLLQKHNHQFTKAKAKDMYLHALNYCVKKMNSGYDTYAQKYFELYVSLLENKVMYDGPYLPQSAYMNIMKAGIRHGKLDWTEDFIKEYKSDLAPKIRLNAYNYNLAYLNYQQKDYDKAQRLLMQIDYSDIWYSVNTRLLLLQIYYETDEVDIFFSHAEAFKMYLKRNKLISEDKRKRHQNFIKFTLRLAKIIKGNNKALDKLTLQLEQTPDMANASWLKNKINEKRR